MNERIKKLRKALDLTQQKFATGIGTSANVLTNYETGRIKPSKSVINNICKTYHVREEWLRTGEGEMFEPRPSAALDALARERGMTHSDYVVIEKFLNLKPEIRQAMAEYALEIAAALNSSDTPLDHLEIAGGLTVKDEVSAYREGILLDKSSETAMEDDVEQLAKKAEKITREQAISEKKQDSQASSAKGSDVG